MIVPNADFVGKHCGRPVAEKEVLEMIGTGKKAKRPSNRRLLGRLGKRGFVSRSKTATLGTAKK